MNGHAPDCMCLGCQLQRAALLVDEPTFRARVATLTRGGLPSSSIPNGSRGADTPIPVADFYDERNKRAEVGVKDAYDRWLAAQDRAWTRGTADALKGLRRAEAAQRAVLGVMGVEFPREGDPKYVEKLIKAVKEARSKANQELADEEQGEHRFQCRTCTGIFKRTVNQRPRAGRCDACLKEWEAAGRPDDRSPERVPIVEARRARRQTKEERQAV